MLQTHVLLRRSAATALRCWVPAAAHLSSSASQFRELSAISGPAPCNGTRTGTNRTSLWAAAVAAAGIAAAWAGYERLPGPVALAEAAPRSFTKAEVAQHKTPEQRIWVTYKDGVYDITEFVAAHPGGAAKIMMAAGGAVDAFWSMYQQHYKSEVQDILAEYKIGTLSDYTPDKPGAAPAFGAGGNPWANEPARHPALISRSTNPCNAETPGAVLAGSLITPTDLFYVRNHLPVPTLEPSTYKLVIEGEGLRRLELSLHDLQTRFKKHTVAATVQCSGNRRNEMKGVKPVKGLDWDIGAIGTATWGGVRLVDVLEAAGLDTRAADSAADTAGGDVAHVHFVGADTDPVTGETYAASIPAHIALAGNRDVILAYEMNGAPLSPDHGYPVRVVVPGVVGARSVKWLTRIVTSPVESGSHWQQRDYKSFSPSTDWDTVDWDSAPAIHDAPVTSAITEPSPGTTLPKGTKTVTVRGYAWSGAGAGIARVDVTADGGASWTTAQLKALPQKPGRAWAWTLWEAEVPVPRGTPPGTALQLAAKATDVNYNSQPDSVAGIWNLRGVVNNAWHRVGVKLE